VHQGRQFIFIVTYGRSGSTVLQSLLQAIPGYFVRGENMNTLYELYKASVAAHTTRYTHGRNPHKFDNPWYGANEIVPENFTKRLVQAFIDEIITPPEGARVIGFKEIRFHEAGTEHFEAFLNFISENFVPSKFIFNTRPWEEVARSGWWANMVPDRVQEIITGADALYSNYMKKYPDRSIHMQHAITRENPEAFKPLFEFLGEDYDAEKVEAIANRRLGHTGV